MGGVERGYETAHVVEPDQAHQRQSGEGGCAEVAATRSASWPERLIS